MMDKMQKKKAKLETLRLTVCYNPITLNGMQMKVTTFSSINDFQLLATVTLNFNCHDSSPKLNTVYSSVKIVAY